MKNLHRYYSQLFRYGSVYLDIHLEKYALNHSYASYIINICKAKDVRQDQMADILGVNRSSVKRAVEHLEKHGYLTREQYEEDKRKFLLIPTQKSFDILDTIFKVKHDWDEIVVQGFTQNEKDIAFDLFDRMTENAKEHIKNNR